MISMTFRWLAMLGCALVVALACVQSAQTYPLGASGAARGVSGSVQLERIEGGQLLVVVALSALPPPEHIANGLREFVVWLEDEHGAQVKAGTLRYDRAHQAGSLLATTNLTAFTVRVTGERDAHSLAPSAVLLAQRKVTTN